MNRLVFLHLFQVLGQWHHVLQRFHNFFLRQLLDFLPWRRSGDVIYLLKYGYRNVIALEGAQGKIPETIKELSKQKKIVIAFLDGDHGGDLILRELLAHNVKIDYVSPSLYYYHIRILLDIRTGGQHLRAVLY